MKPRKRKTDKPSDFIHDEAVKQNVKRKKATKRQKKVKQKKRAVDHDSDSDYDPGISTRTRKSSSTHIDKEKQPDEIEEYRGVLRSDRDLFPSFPPDAVWRKILGYIIKLEQKECMKTILVVDDNFTRDNFQDNQEAFDFNRDDWPAHWTDMDKVFHHKDVIYKKLKITCGFPIWRTEVDSDDMWSDIDDEDNYVAPSDMEKENFIKLASLAGEISVNKKVKCWISEFLHYSNDINATTIKLSLPTESTRCQSSVDEYLDFVSLIDPEKLTVELVDVNGWEFNIGNLWKVITNSLQKSNLKEFTLYLGDNEELKKFTTTKSIQSKVSRLNIEVAEPWRGEGRLYLPWKAVEFTKLEELTLTLPVYDNADLTSDNEDENNELSNFEAYKSHLEIPAKETVIYLKYECNFYGYDIYPQIEKCLKTIREAKPQGTVVVSFPGHVYVEKTWNERNVFLFLWALFVETKTKDVDENRFDLSVYYDRIGDDWYQRKKKVSFDLAKPAKLAAILDIDLALPLVEIRLRCRTPNGQRMELSEAYQKLVTDTFRQEFVSGLQLISELKVIHIDMGDTIEGPFAVDDTLASELEKIGYPFINPFY